jgi:hypothetical protein
VGALGLVTMTLDFSCLYDVIKMNQRLTLRSFVVAIRRLSATQPTAGAHNTGESLLLFETRTKVLC